PLTPNSSLTVPTATGIIHYLIICNHYPSIFNARFHQQTQRITKEAISISIELITTKSNKKRPSGFRISHHTPAVCDLQVLCAVHSAHHNNSDSNLHCSALGGMPASFRLKRSKVTQRRSGSLHFVFFGFAAQTTRSNEQAYSPLCSHVFSR
ncbi:hypothetical protein CAOG_08469, partial [Capsaspora owczarzaki ATCC 30864]|uniref:hypothetical protein n=1 Tax=Capsaspora owczarzaki (strain ATCC 30864) TaxID=595528 RepID=UPI0003524327